MQTQAAISRRNFVTAGAGIAVLSRHVLGRGYQAPSDRLNVACVGVAGMGRNNIAECSNENIVALCDVDDARAADVYEKYPKAARYKDFRKMLEQEKTIDAVIVATPDHTHAVIAMMAIKLGKHVYVQKPLSRTIGEARRLAAAAREYKVATQMGNQGHSGEGVRLVSEWIRDGAIGPVHEVHCFTNRPRWPQGIGRPVETPPVPVTLAWDLWLGPAPVRPYHRTYTPALWRAWLDFGCGALGDMGCHIIDAPYTALKLGYPQSVEGCAADQFIAQRQKFENHETFPIASVVHYSFPARENMPAVELHWYEGGMRPPRPKDLERERNLMFGDGGSIIVGDKGSIICGAYGESPRIIPESRMREYQRPPKTLPRITGTHEQNWIDACKGGPAACSNFDYSGPLTETVLLGNLALRFPGELLLWDSTNRTVTNLPAANELLEAKYREGWALS
ncbi:MAG: Gfo/Idh/MocA family protein [Acidobacteriota bacterium]